MIELALLPQHLQLEPGGLTRATVSLHAADAPAATYGLEIHGLEQGWYTLSVPEVPVAPQADGQAVLTLHPPLEAGRGVYPFELLASHPDDPALGGRIEALLVIAVAAGAETTAAAVPLAAAPLSRRSALIAAAAVAALLLLCAGVAYGLGGRSSPNHVAAPPCATPSAASCTPSPTPRKGTGSATAGRGDTSRTPTSRPTGLPGSTFPAPKGTADAARTPTTGSLPVPGPRARATVTATTLGAVPATSPTVPAAVPPRLTPHGLTFPGLPGSPAHSGKHKGGGSVVPATAGAGTAIANPAGTATANPGGTGTETPTNTATAPGAPLTGVSATPTRTATPVATTRQPPTITVPPQPTATATLPHPTATVPPTFTPIPTGVPPTLTATTPPTATPSPSATAGNSPTPAIVRLLYSYEIVDNQFTLKWQTENAVALTVDGQLETVPSGSQSYTLQTHTYALTATGADGSRQIKGISVQVVGDCEVTVNGAQTTVQSDRCRLLQQSQTRPSPTATVAPTLTTVPLTPAASPTAMPTSPIPANAFPTETPALTYTPAPSDTPAPPPTAFPTDTPSPAPSTPGQDTPVGGT